MRDAGETPEQGIGETERKADQELRELEHEGDEMEERLEAAGNPADESAVANPAEPSEPGVDEADLPEGEGESAERAGQ
jgi:hypothetical protein